MRDLVTLLLRLALGVAFLSAVADRMGFWGAPDAALSAWGNWENFLLYTSTLTFGASGGLVQFLGFTATILEFVFGLFLIVGYKVKSTAFLSGILLLLFGIGMSFNTHLKFALDYSVFTAVFACFLLALQPIGKYSLDYLFKKS